MFAAGLPLSHPLFPVRAVPLKPRPTLEVPGAKLFVPSSRSLVENAVQSCLLIPDLSTKDAVEARLLRAKTRFVSGYTLGARRGSFPLPSYPSEWLITCYLLFACTMTIDIEAALMLDPEHAEAKSLMSSLVPHARVVRIPELDFAGYD